MIKSTYLIFRFYGILNNQYGDDIMVKHIIIWKLKEEIKDKDNVKAKIKTELENLEGKIAGLEEMKILTEGFDSSSGDIMMNSTFSDNTSLKAYQSHPLHVEVATRIVRPNVAQRLSFDFEI